MDDKLPELWQMFAVWLSLAQEARELANSSDEPTLGGYYQGIADALEAASNELRQWVETFDSDGTGRSPDDPPPTA